MMAWWSCIFNNNKFMILYVRPLGHNPAEVLKNYEVNCIKKSDYVCSSDQFTILGNTTLDSTFKQDQVKTPMLSVFYIWGDSVIDQTVDVIFTQG